MTDVDAAIRALEARLAHLEDRLSLLQLVASYGPAVDAGESAAAASLWTEDGVYDTYPEPLLGADAIAAMVEGPRHQGYIHEGCAHFLGTPHIVISGDHAQITLYSLLLRRDADQDRYWVWRAAANHWDCVRSADGWKITNRVNRLLDGTDEAWALLRPAAGKRNFS